MMTNNNSKTYLISPHHESATQGSLIFVSTVEKKRLPTIISSVAVIIEVDQQATIFLAKTKNTLLDSFSLSSSFYHICSFSRFHNLKFSNGPTWCNYPFSAVSFLSNLNDILCSYPFSAVLSHYIFFQFEWEYKSCGALYHGDNISWDYI